MTDSDPKKTRRAARKSFALSELARLREGLRDGSEAPRERSQDSARRLRQTFSDDDEQSGRIAPPQFGRRPDFSAPNGDPFDPRPGSRREATRLGDADEGETDQRSLVRSMLKDRGIGSVGEAAGGGYDRPDYDEYGDERYGEPHDDDYADQPAAGGGYGYGRDDDRYGDDAEADERYGDERYEGDRYGDEHYDDETYDAGYERDQGGDFAEPHYDEGAGDYDDGHAASDEAPWPGRRSRRRGLDAAGAGLGGARAASAAPYDDEHYENDEAYHREPAREDGFPSQEGDTYAPDMSPPSGRPPAPFGLVERMLAGRYLRARRKEGFISVIAMLSLIGVTLSVAVLIVVMSVMNGFRAELVGKIIGINGHMTVASALGPFDDYEETATKIRAVPGAWRAAPIINGQVFASGPFGNGGGALVRGMTQEDLLRLEKVSIAPEFSTGSLSEFGQRRGVAIGWEMATALGLGVGDKITLLTPKGVATPFGVAPRRRDFEVQYIFKVGMFQIDSAFIFMPLAEAQDFFSVGDAVTEIEIMVDDPDRIERYETDIAVAAGDKFTMTDWKTRNSDLVGALGVERTVMFFILSMLVLIASLVIISGLIMLVKEKGPDIAILRTMGLTRSGVMRVFFICGAAIGVIGTALGVVLGVLTAWNISDIKEFIEATFGVSLFPENVYFLSRLPSELHWGDVGFTVLITLTIAFLATLYPARRAARLDPVEALRYE